MLSSSMKATFLMFIAVIFLAEHPSHQQSVEDVTPTECVPKIKPQGSCKGNEYWDDMVENCRPCSRCCNDSYEVPECIGACMPSSHTCTEEDKCTIYCKEPELNHVTYSPTKEQYDEHDNVTLDCKSGYSLPKNAARYMQCVYPGKWLPVPQSCHKDPFPWWGGLLIVVGILLFIGFILVMISLWRKWRKQKREMRNLENRQNENNDRTSGRIDEVEIGVEDLGNAVNNIHEADDIERREESERMERQRKERVEKKKNVTVKFNALKLHYKPKQFSEVMWKDSWEEVRKQVEVEGVEGSQFKPWELLLKRLGLNDTDIGTLKQENVQKPFIDGMDKIISSIKSTITDMEVMEKMLDTSTAEESGCLQGLEYIVNHIYAKLPNASHQVALENPEQHTNGSALHIDVGNEPDDQRDEDANEKAKLLPPSKGNGR